jgi:hypothetical protein
MERKAYPTDLTDDEWAFVAPSLTLMTEDAPQGPPSLREVFNGLRWIVRDKVKKVQSRVAGPPSTRSRANVFQRERPLLPTTEARKEEARCHALRAAHVLLRHRIAGLLPGHRAAFDDFDIGEALGLIPCCLTGRCGFGRSCTVEDDLLVFGQRRHARRKLR